MFKLVQRGMQWSNQNIASLFTSKFEPVTYEVITWYAMIKGTSSNDQIKLLHHYVFASHFEPVMKK